LLDLELCSSYIELAGPGKASYFNPGKEESMKRIVRFLTLLVAAILIYPIQPIFAADAPIVIKFAHQLPVTDHVSIGVDHFAKQLAERSKGRVKVDVYPASMLYKDTEVIPAVRDGAIQMGFCPINMVESYVPIAELISLPFLSPTQETMKKIKYGKPGKLLIEKMDQIGLKHIWWGDYGMVDLFTTKKPVRKPEDLKGLKIRIVGGKMTTETFKALGASPVFITSTEVYMALSKGATDGLITGFNSVYSRKYYEIAKYATKLNLFFSLFPTIMNMKFWQSLPNETKGLIQDVAKEAEAKIEKLSEEQEVDYINKCKEKGMIVYYLTKEDRALFLESVKPVWEDFAKRYGKEGEEVLQWIRANP
jgi:tripartite ATP-independent transporter DctP family solute receptor